jgi:hypothetical protein
VRAVKVAGQHAYIFSGDSVIFTLDIANPATLPVQAMFIVPGIAKKMVIQDERLFLAADHFRRGQNEGMFLLALDISRPDQITQMGRLDLLPPPYATVQGLVINGDYLYLGGSKVSVINVTDPHTPRLVDNLDAIMDMVNLVQIGERGYVGGFYLALVDLSEPARPTVLSGLILREPEPDPEEPPESTRVGPLWLTLQGDTAVMVDYGSAGCGHRRCRSIVWGMDVTTAGLDLDPEPLLKLDVQATDVVFSDGWIYLAHRNGLQIIDARRPSATRHAGSLDTTVSLEPLPDGRFAYVSPVLPSNHLQFDANDPAELKALLTLNDWDATVMIGNYLYTGKFGLDLTVYDARNLAALTEVATVPGEAFGFALADGYLYSNGRGVIGVIDITTPSRPRLVTTFDGIRGYTYALATAGNYLYVASSQGLYVLDVNVPAQPVIVYFWPSNEELRDVAVIGHTLYIAASRCQPVPPNCEGGGLWLADISDPAAPRLAAQFPLAGLDQVVVTAEQVYLISRPRLDEVWVIDISDPAGPVRLNQTRLPEPWGYYKVAFANGRLYLYNRNTGWLVYQLEP